MNIRNAFSKKKLILIGLTFLTAFIVIICRNQKEIFAENKNIKVVSSTNFYGETAKAVLGNKGKVSSIINKGSVDPHDYDPTTKTAKKVNQAKVVIYNGIGYDDWINKLTKKSQSKINVGKLMGKENGDNEHVWYNSKTMPKLAYRLAKKYSKIKPHDKSYFYKNAKKYNKKISSVASKENHLKVKNNKNKVDVSEPVYDYTLSKLGYKVRDRSFELAIENGTDPSAKDVKNIRKDIKQKRIAFFVNNTQASDKTVGNFIRLAHKKKIPVLNVTETQPQGKNYKSWMLNQFRRLKKIQNRLAK